VKKKKEMLSCFKSVLFNLWNTSPYVPLDAGQDLKQQWAIIQQASSEVAYRESLNDDTAMEQMHKDYNEKVMNAVYTLCKEHYMTVMAIASHMQTMKHNVHLYSVSIDANEEGARLPGSEFGRRYKVLVYFGNRLKFKAFVQEQLKLTMEELDQRLSNSGFSQMK
jgi:hypothetical protein